MSLGHSDFVMVLEIGELYSALSISRSADQTACQDFCQIQNHGINEDAVKYILFN